MPTISVEDLAARACALAGMDDPRPSHFLANLRALVECINEQAQLTEQGNRSILSQLLPALRNRIEVDMYSQEHPGLGSARLGQPIFLTGLPRSGTTYFQYLFDQDPRFRMLRTWEGERPVPPPALDPESAKQRQAETAERARRNREATGGKIDAFHLTDVDGPQECLAILDQTFVNPGLLWTLSVPGYLDYLLASADLREAYRYHADVLRLLQEGSPDQRWALKWPCHLLALDVIEEIHPSASFVVTHRDPVQALASNCSLTRMLRAGNTAQCDAAQIGRDMLELIRQHVNRLVAFDVEQDKLGTSRLVHVDYYRLVDSPATVMSEVFDSLDLEWTPEIHQRVLAWRAANPPGKRGRHEYHLEEFGLSRGEVAEAFASYIDRFDIPAEEAQA